MTQAVFTGTFAASSAPRRLDQQPHGPRWTASSVQPVTPVSGTLAVGDYLETNGGVATLAFNIDNTAGTAVVQLVRSLRGVDKETLATVAAGATGSGSGVIDSSGEEIRFKAIP